MSLHVAIHHHTSYKYDRLIQVAPQLVRLRPTPYAPNPIGDYSLRISPENHLINWFEDPFGNHLARVIFPDKITELVIDVAVTIDMATVNPFNFYLEEYAHNFPFSYTGELAEALHPYLQTTESGEQLKDFLAGSQVQGLLGQSTVSFLVALTSWLAGAIHYNIRLEPGVQSCETTLALRSGSCRDTAWLLVQLLRHLGLAARFVSGYLVQLMTEAPDSPKEDSVDLHAWCEVYLPGAGWVGMDATSGLLTGEGHIPLAAATTTAAAAPLSGYSDPAEVNLQHVLTLTRIAADHQEGDDTAALTT